MSSKRYGLDSARTYRNLSVLTDNTCLGYRRRSWSLASGMRLLLRRADLKKGPIAPWKQAQVVFKVNAVLLSCFVMQQDDPRQLLAL